MKMLSWFKPRPVAKQEACKVAEARADKLRYEAAARRRALLQKTIEASKGDSRNG